MEELKKILESADEMTKKIKADLVECDKTLERIKRESAKVSHEAKIQELLEKMASVPKRKDLTKKQKQEMYSELEILYARELNKAKRESSNYEKALMYSVEGRIDWVW